MEILMYKSLLSAFRVSKQNSQNKKKNYYYLV